MLQHYCLWPLNVPYANATIAINLTFPFLLCCSTLSVSVYSEFYHVVLYYVWLRIKGRLQFFFLIPSLSLYGVSVLASFVSKFAVSTVLLIVSCHGLLCCNSMCSPSFTSSNINTVFPVLKYGHQLHCTRGRKVLHSWMIKVRHSTN